MDHRPARGFLQHIGFHLIAGAVAAIFVVPLIWVVIASLRLPGLPPPRGIDWLPSPVAWGNYRELFVVLPIGGYLLNSLVVSSASVAITLLVASWAGFAMSRLPQRVRGWLVLLAVGLRLVPLTTLWLARFVIFTRLQLTDTLWVLIAPAWMGTSPFYVLLFYWNFRRLPAELFDAARLDGAGVLGTWARVAMPLAAPTTAAVAVLAFVHYWSDFINPLLYLKSERNYTLAIGLRVLQQFDSTNWPLLMAGAVVMMLPILAVFLMAQRVFFHAGGER